MMHTLTRHLWGRSVDEAAELARAELEREIKEAKDREEYKQLIPYEQRVKDFIKWAAYNFYNAPLKETSFTFESSYKKDGCTARRRITFGPEVKKRFFFDDEDHPCLLKGSIAAMRAEERARDYYNVGVYHFVYEVFERYVRKRKLTILSDKEWYQYRKKGGGVRILERIIEKAGRGFSEDYLNDAIRLMVNERQRTCLINGKIYHFSNEAAWSVTKELFEHANKADRILRRLK